MRNFKLKPAALAGILLLVATSIHAGERVAVITAVQGKVEVQRAGENSWRPALSRMELKVSDKVVTKKGGRCEIVLDDGSLIKMRENSTLEINDLKEEEGTKKKSSVFKLLMGKLWAKAEPQEGARFEVITPAAIAGIRGTEFAIIVLSDGTSDVLVFKGSIEVKSLMEEVREIKTMIVEAGKALGIKPGEAGLMREINPQEIEDWQKFVEGKRALLIKPATDEERGSLKQDISDARDNFAQNRRFAYAVKDADLSAGKTLLDHAKRLTRVQQYLMRPTPNILRFLNLCFRPGQTEQWQFHYWQNDWYFTNPLPRTLTGTVIILLENNFSSSPGNPLLKAESIFANNAPERSNNRDVFLWGWERGGNPNSNGMYVKVNGKPVTFDNNWNGKNEGFMEEVQEMTENEFYNKARMHFIDRVKGTIDWDLYIIDNNGKTLGAGDFAGADASKLFQFRNNINFETVFDLKGMEPIVGQMKNGGVIDVVVIPEIVYSGIERIISELGDMLHQLQNSNPPSL